MGKSRIADPLREYGAVTAEPIYLDRWTIEKIADEIDREHERRMDQAREDSRKHTCNYLSRVTADYKRGRKWKRKEYE